MGIKHFQMFMRNHFSDHMHKIRKHQVLSDVKINGKSTEVDNLMIDMNGVFHNSTQKVYEYGNFKPNQRLLRGRNPRRKPRGLHAQLKVFEDICKTVEDLFKLTKPKKKHHNGVDAHGIFFGFIWLDFLTLGTPER